MAGNTINVQGSYIDVHDNEVVNLNIDKAAVMLQDGSCQTEDMAKRAAVLTENEEFMAIMRRAVEGGFCVQDGWQFKWKEKIDAVYFASVASHKFHLSHRHDSDGGLSFAWKPFEALFGEKDFRSKYNDYLQGKIKLRHKMEIDKLLR